MQDVTETVGPDGMAKEESTDPLSLQGLSLNSRMQKTDPTSKAGTATDLDVRR